MNNQNDDSKPTELKINQERLLVIKDEYQRLCYEMKKKELTRHSTHTKMQQQIRQQWEIISDLKKQKSDLTLQLRLQESDSFSNKGNQNLVHFKKSLEEVIRLENQLKRQAEELERYKKDIAEINKKIRQKQKEVLKAQRSSGRILKYQKNISFLENRLNGSLHKYNQLLIANNSLRDDISSLLLTQSSFRRKYSNIKRLLSLGKKTLLEVVHSATMSYQTGESVKYKLNLVKERTQVDQRRLGEKIKELKILVEQDKQLKEFLEFKMKEGVGPSTDQELEAQNEQILEQRLQTNHGIMARIQLASGCKDVNRICKSYLQEEENNLALFEKVNEMSLEIEKLLEEVRAQRQALDAITRQFKEQNRKDLAEKTDIENCTDKFRVEAQELEDAADIKAEELEMIKKALKKIYAFLDIVSSQKITFTVDDGITDDNILQYLEVLERRIIDVIRCEKLASQMKNDFTKQLLRDKKYSQKQPEEKKILKNYYEQKSLSSSHPAFQNKEQKVNFLYNKDHLETFAKTFLLKLQCSPEYS